MLQVGACRLRCASPCFVKFVWSSPLQCAYTCETDVQHGLRMRRTPGSQAGSPISTTMQDAGSSGRALRGVDVDANPLSEITAAEMETIGALAPQYTATGVRVDAGDVLVGRAGEHEAVFTQTTLTHSAEDSGLLRGTVSFSNATVEGDFISFMHRSRTALLVVATYLTVLNVSLLAAGLPLKPPRVLLPIVATAAALGLLLTDAATRRLQNSCLRGCVLSRVARARFAEQLMAVVVVCGVAGSYLQDPMDNGIVFCPNASVADDVAFAGKALPWPSADRLSYAVSTHHCVADSWNNGGSLTFITVAISGRLVCLAPWLCVFCVLSMLISACAPFGTALGVSASWYNVGTLELARRCAATVAVTIVALIGVAVVDRRIRRRFEVAAFAAVAIRERERTGVQLRALQQLVAPRPAEECCVAQRHVALHCRLHNMHRMGNDTEGDWRTRFDAVKQILLLADAPAHVHVWAHGNTISAATLFAPDESHVTEARAGAGTGTPAEDEAANAAGRVMCFFAQRLIHAVERAATVVPTLKAADVHASVAVVMSLSPVAVANTDRHTLATLPALRQACEVCTSSPLPRARATVCATTRATVRGDFPIQAMLALGGTEVSYVLGEAVGPPADAAEGSAAFLTPDSTDDCDADGTALRLDVHLTETTYCGCSERCHCWCTRTFAPRFVDDGIERDFIEHDNAHAAPQALASSAIALVVNALLLGLVVADPYKKTERVRTSGIGVAVGGVVGACVTLVCVSLLLRPGRMSTHVRAGLYVGIAVVVLAPWGYLTRISGFPFVRITEGPPATVFALVPLLPQQPALRYGLASAAGAYLAIVTPADFAPGHAWVWQARFLLLPVMALLAVLHMRYSRSEFATTHYLLQVQGELNAARAVMDATLSTHMPPAYVARLRDDPDGPALRAHWCPCVTVLALQVPPTAAADALVARVRAIATELPSAIVRIHGDSVVAVAEADRLVAAQPPRTEAVILQALLCGVFGQQPALPPTPVYTVARFPIEAPAIVRAALHRGSVVMGLLGAARCSFGAFGLAVDGAVALCRTSIALGRLLVSADADWSLTPTHTVPGIGSVAALPLDARNAATVPKQQRQSRARLPVIAGQRQVPATAPVTSTECRPK